MITALIQTQAPSRQPHAGTRAAEGVGNQMVRKVWGETGQKPAAFSEGHCVPQPELKFNSLGYLTNKKHCHILILYLFSYLVLMELHLENQILHFIIIYILSFCKPI